MSSIYTYISPKKIKALRGISIIIILISSFALVKILGENKLEIILMLFSLILGVIPYAINPKPHLQSLLAPINKLENSFSAYFSSINKADHLCRDIGLYFFLLWILAVIIY